MVNFAPLKAHFLSIYCGAHAAVPTLPSVPAIDVAVTRNAIDAAPPGRQLGCDYVWSSKQRRPWAGYRVVVWHSPDLEFSLLVLEVVGMRVWRSK